MTISLVATKRTEIGKRAKRLLMAGRLPAVVYGPAQEATPVSLPLNEFEKVLRDAGESTVLELSGVGSSPLQVLIHEVDRDPVTNAPRHADLYAIEKGAKVEVAVPLEFIGESPAVKAGASLVKVMHELEIEAEAANLPQEIEVDISALTEVGAQLHVSDLKLPPGVTLKDDPAQVVVLVQEAREEEETPTQAPDMSAIEVEKKGKGEEEAQTSATA